MAKLALGSAFAIIAIARASFSSANTSCAPDGTCRGQGATCCSGQAHGTLSCGFSFCKELGCEQVCEKAVGTLIPYLSQKTCDEIVGQSDSICEKIGCADGLKNTICKAVLTNGCPLVAKLIKQGVSDPQKICSSIGKFDDDGSRCGCVNDGECGMSRGDCCSGQAHHTAACGSNIRCGCLADGKCAGLDGVKGCCSGRSHRTAACGSTIRCGSAFEGSADSVVV